MAVDKYGYSEKWSADIAEKGFTQVPNCLLTCQNELGVTSSELSIILQILFFKFDTRSPYPSIRLLSAMSGTSVGTVRRNIRKLEDKGLLIRRYRTGTSSMYDFGPLISRLHSHFCVWGGQKRSPLGAEMETLPRPETVAKENQRQQIPSNHTPTRLSSSRVVPTRDDFLDISDIPF